MVSRRDFVLPTCCPVTVQVERENQPGPDRRGRGHLAGGPDGVHRRDQSGAYRALDCLNRADRDPDPRQAARPPMLCGGPRKKHQTVSDNAGNRVTSSAPIPEPDQRHDHRNFSRYRDQAHPRGPAAWDFRGSAFKAVPRRARGANPPGAISASLANLASGRRRRAPSP